MRSDQGMSLVEVTVILAVLAILSAAVAPSMADYLRDARSSSAKADVEAIGGALQRMLADVGETFVLRDGNGASATAAPLRAPSNRVDLLVSEGNTPVVGIPRSSGTPDWDAAVDNAAVQTLDQHLVANTPGNAAANRYRIATDMSVTGNFDPDSGATFNSPYAWRGAYLPGPIGADPWGNRYSVNSEFLARAPGPGPAGNVNDVMVISAGQNGRLEVRFDTDGATTAGDDILYVVSGGTR